MIFVSVGTTHPFDRLIRAVDEAVERRLVEERVYAQIGSGAYEPRNFEYVRSMGKHAFDECVRSASGIISHAGMGILTAALDHDKPVLAMPRRKCYGEAVNDHQVAIAREFARLGHVLVAWEPADLFREIVKLGGFVPAPRRGQAAAVVDRVRRFLDDTQLAMSLRFREAARAEK